MPLQRPGDVKGRDQAGHANRYAKTGFKESLTLILGQAPREMGPFAAHRGSQREIIPHMASKENLRQNLLSQRPSRRSI
jgi:hypothetical protein